MGADHETTTGPADGVTGINPNHPEIGDMNGDISASLDDWFCCTGPLEPGEFPNALGEGTSAEAEILGRDDAVQKLQSHPGGPARAPRTRNSADETFSVGKERHRQPLQSGKVAVRLVGRLGLHRRRSG